MELRMLDKSEHGLTRQVWERIFEEDSKVFLDYYYFFKTRDNEIYVIEEDGEIRSMLHLNPYTIQMEEEQFAGKYIIAVATEETYRKRGYMGLLLRKAMQEMYDRKELFTFLMPASESIYTHYDFRFVYDQNVWIYTISKRQAHRLDKENKSGNVQRVELSGENLPERGKKPVVAEAGIADGSLLADFFNTHFAERFQVYAVRDENYYQIMLFEQQSENGGIRFLKENGKVVGAFLYGDEAGLEIREPLYLKEFEEEFWNAVNQLCAERGQKQAIVYAGIKMNDPCKNRISVSEKAGLFETEKINIAEKQKKPTIMVRIIHLESLLKALKVKEGEEIDCSFAVLDAFLPQNSRVWRIQNKSLISSDYLEEMSDENNEEVNTEAESQKEKVRGSEQVEISRDLVVRETEDSEGILSIAALTSFLFGYKTVEEIAGETDVYLTERLKGELRKLQPLKSVYLNEIV